MTDRVTITDARRAFERWVAAMGVTTTVEAREKNWPITNTFHLEEWRIGDGKVTVRIAQITSESGAERAAILEGRRSPREFVDMVRAAVESLELRQRLPRHDPEQDRIQVEMPLHLRRVDPDPNVLRYADEYGRRWSSVMSERGHNCAEVSCGRHFQAGYVLNVGMPGERDEEPFRRPTICYKHIAEGGYHAESFFSTAHFTI